MATIHQTIDTNKTAAEMRHLIDSKVLTRPELRLLLDETRWEGNVLHAKGKLGHGTVAVEERKVVIHIELSLFGSAARGQIEQALSDQVKRLGQ
jgi:hypothetical protein